MLLLGMEMLLQHSASIGYEDRIVCWMKWVKKSKMYGDGMAYLNIWKYIFSYGIYTVFLFTCRRGEGNRDCGSVRVVRR